MSKKVYGITKNTLECEIYKYQVDNILKRSVPVVSVEEIEKRIRKRPCKSCEYWTNWLKELKEAKK